MTKFSKKALRESIGFEPHEAQKELLECDKNEIAVCAGRRMGKTYYAAYLVLETLAKNIFQLTEGKDVEPATIWIVAPNYNLTEKVFNQFTKWFVQIFPQFADSISRRIPAKLHLPGGIGKTKGGPGPRIECKSGENPSGMLGEGLDLVVMDEASRCKREVYDSFLYPALDSNNGRFVAISTPLGKNWFFDFYQRLKDQDAAFHYTSKAGVMIDDEKWERAKKKLPKGVFDQEYRAIFLDSAYSVFRRDDIDAITGNCLKDAVKSHSYIMGLDLAQINDWTVMTVIDQDTHEVVYHERFQKQPYDKNRLKVSSVAKRYNNSRIIIDSQNVGSSFGDELRNMGHMVDDYSTAGRVPKDLNKRGKKQQIIHRLQVLIEGHKITIPEIGVLKDELDSYTMDISDKGTVTYTHPPGYHDDCVDSLALAAWGLHSIEAENETPVQKEIKTQQQKQLTHNPF